MIVLKSHSRFAESYLTYLCRSDIVETALDGGAVHVYRQRAVCRAPTCREMRSTPHAAAVHLQPVGMFLVSDPRKTSFRIGHVSEHVVPL